jgi:hypothetical protein
MIRLSAVLLLALLSVPACKRSRTTSSQPGQPQNVAKIDACSLITREEVSVVQSTTISDTKGSETSDGSRLVTQCYYASTGPNLSVSLALTQPDSTKAGAPSPREYWQQIFGPYRHPAKEEDKEREEAEETQRKGGDERGEEGEERKNPPKKIDGVGEEAFWAGSRFGGALYVLQKNYILRISVGGPADQVSKIDKSKALAQKALSRL